MSTIIVFVLNFHIQWLYSSRYHIIVGKVNGDFENSLLMLFEWCTYYFSSVQLLSHVRLFVTPWTAAHQGPLSVTNFQSLPKLIVHWVNDAIQPSHPLSAPSPPALNLSLHQGLFRWVRSSHEVAKVLEFSFSISPCNEHPGLISFRMNWLDPLAVQGALKSLLQHHSSKASILLHSAFFIVQFSHPYMTTGKTTALTLQTFVSKVMSLLF